MDKNYRFICGRLKVAETGTGMSGDHMVCTTGTFSPPVVPSKYPASGTAIAANYGTSSYDTAPLGAFGGLGVIQLMAPPGPVGVGETPDNTNTVLDDRIKVFQNGVLQTGAAKQSLLAWRGFPDINGQLVDDNGVATNIGDSRIDVCGRQDPPRHPRRSYPARFRTCRGQ